MIVVSLSESALRTARSYRIVAASARASAARICALMRPPEKIGQRSDGPTWKRRLSAEKRSPGSRACWPMPPSRERRGNSSAVATPTSAVDAASSRSAWRMSGRRRNRSDRRPAPTSILTGGSEPGRRSRSYRASGGCPSSNARRNAAAAASPSNPGIVAAVLRAWAWARTRSKREASPTRRRSATRRAISSCAFASAIAFARRLCAVRRSI